MKNIRMISYFLSKIIYSTIKRQIGNNALRSICVSKPIVFRLFRIKKTINPKVNV